MNVCVRTSKWIRNACRMKNKATIYINKWLCELSVLNECGLSFFVCASTPWSRRVRNGYSRQIDSLSKKNELNGHLAVISRGQVCSERTERDKDQ